MPYPAMLLGAILSTTIPISYSFQFLRIPSGRKHWLQDDVHSRRDTASSFKLHVFTHLQKGGGTRNHTTGDFTTSPLMYVEENKAETAKVITTTAGDTETISTNTEKLVGSNDIFPFIESASMQELTNLEDIIQRTIEEDLCGNDKDGTTSSLDDNDRESRDDYGYATERNNGSSAKQSGEIPTPPITYPARHFPFTDDESIQEVENLEAFLRDKIEVEAHIAKLENLVLEPEKYPMTQPGTNVLALWEGLSLDASAAVNTRNGYVTKFVEVKSSAATIQNQKIIEARLLLLGSAALYGTNFPLVKILDESLPVGACTSLRFTIGALVLLPWLLPKNAVIGKNNNDINSDDSDSWGPTLAGLEVGMWNSVAYIAQAVGLQTVSASKSAFICSLAVVMVPLLDAMTGKVLSSKKMYGIMVAVLGVAILEMGSCMFEVNAVGGDALGSGDIISFLQPIAFGIGFWRLERHSSRYPEDSMRITSAQLFAIALASVLYCALSAPPSLDEVIGWVSDLHILGALVWTGLVTTALTLYMEAIALRTVTATETTLILSAEPIFGSFFASLLVGERMGLEAAVGAFLILMGCLSASVADDENLDSNVLKP